MSRLRHRKVGYFAEIQVASKWQNWDMILSSLILEPVVWTIMQFLKT